MQGSFSEKQNVLESLNRYSLLVLDDLGAERSTEYMQEIVYNIVDWRYRSGKPMIVTTNLTGEQMKATDNIQLQRIYDRIFERCLPIEVNGQSRRKQKTGCRSRGYATKTGNLKGVQMSKGLNLRPHQIEEMKKLKKEGKSIREIAKLYGVSMSTVVRKTQDIPDTEEKPSAANMEDLLKQWDYLHERYGTKK